MSVAQKFLVVSSTQAVKFSLPPDAIRHAKAVGRSRKQLQMSQMSYLAHTQWNLSAYLLQVLSHLIAKRF
jgi:hypothetical protein